MEKILTIDGREVGFKASGATTRIYRSKFGREFFDDFESLSKEVGKTGTLGKGTLEIFEDLAYTMAFQYDRTIPADPDEWLDQFSVFSIYQILPELMELMMQNTQQLETPKKKDEGLSAA